MYTRYDKKQNGMHTDGLGHLTNLDSREIILYYKKTSNKSCIYIAIYFMTIHLLWRHYGSC